MTTATYTVIHVLISLVAILAGLVVMFGLIGGKQLNAWTAIFLATTVATSVTGFGFPFHKLEPPHIVGLISLVVLVIAIIARYSFHLARGWRSTYVVTSAIALYLNVFVLVVQAFGKIAPLKALAPKQTEPPFVISQAAVLVLFIVLTVFATKRFRIVQHSLA